jgi:FdhD protein
VRRDPAPREPESSSSRQVEILRVTSSERNPDQDIAATEEPLEVRIDGRPFAVIMRTPGADRELTAGFLFSEAVIRHAGEIGTIRHCGHAADSRAQNVMNVTLVGVDTRRQIEDRRRVTMNSSCGLCGRLTLESLETAAPYIDAALTVDAATVRQLPLVLRDAQTVFSQTGGLHAAGLFNTAGELQALAEDVGRHNAVDKVIGRMLLLQRLPLPSSLLFVSGRTSYEIVQKAFLAGIPIVAAVSAPSTLAIDLAREAGMTLIGFVRGDRFNVYTHPERINPIGSPG